MSASIVDKETLKSKNSAAEGKNELTIFHKICEINLRNQIE